MKLSDFRNIHFIGLKGSGMCSLAILLQQNGYIITGSDISDTFYTDALLVDAGIECKLGFKKENISSYTDLVIYSAAYTPENNEELQFAMEHYTCILYPEALGLWSMEQLSCAVVGTHGKTTTTAMIGVLCKALNFPVMVLTGARVNDWKNSIWYGGDQGLIAEVCEYRNHFKYFNPSFIVYTSAELDHPDYFSNEAEVVQVFKSFLQKIQGPKIIIACTQHQGVRDTLDSSIAANIISYGNSFSDTDSQAYGVSYIIKDGEYEENGVQKFSIKGLDELADTLDWNLIVPGKALIANAVASLVFIREWAKVQGTSIDWHSARNALATFCGISRRCELLYQSEDITILDDYAHHPTAIHMTLEGIKNFYKPKRLIVDFMPHTYTRTSALLNDFVCSFSAADVVLLNDIYASAREQQQYQQSYANQDLADKQSVQQNQGEMATNVSQDVNGDEPIYINGKIFSEKVSEKHSHVYYFPQFDQAADWVIKNLQAGDLFVTMGAGDNFRIASSVIKELENKL